ncbi:MAG: hypothetical protein RLY49_421 [Candidatus Parcubacteria bacterium]|jgi:hypothetical protein
MNKNNTQKGQVIIINTLMFFALSVAIIFALTSPVVSSFNITKSFSKSKQSFLVANSAVNEAMYKLNTNKSIASSETLALSQGSATIAVADTGMGKMVSVSSDVDSYKRNYELALEAGSGVSFNYGLQVGQGGFDISGGSGIIGNVYANGDIVGSNGAYITGTAVSANISDPVSVTSNNIGTIDPGIQINFGGNSTSTPQDVAQSFTVSTTTPVSSIRILIKKTNSPWSNVTLRITTDNAGKPSKTDIAQGTISASTVTSSFNYLSIPLSSTISLTPGTTYWLVFDSTNFWGPYYSLGANENTFSGGALKLAQNGWSQSNGGTWIDPVPNTLDAYFDIYVGGSTGVIDGVAVGTGVLGDAWSYEVKNSTIAGTAYCQSGTSNNKACDISRGVPVQQTYPISDGNIIDWKAEATAGGATSTKSYGSGTYSLGPTKIEGDLSVGSGGILNLDGTVYVTGTILVNGGGIVRVNPSLSNKSVVLLADGTIKTNGGGQFAGSGSGGSYIMLVTTSNCPNGVGCSGENAVDISGGAGAVVINAQNGTLSFSGGAQAKQATAHRIEMDGGTTVTYESGLVNPVFNTGPSGAWTVSSWKEVE